MTVAALLAFFVWVYLLCAHGRFWQAGPVLPDVAAGETPTVAIVIPARNEAASVAATLRSLVAQDYPGPFRIVLVDDNSTDATAEIAKSINDPRITILSGLPRPPGWSGKLWAVSQGIAAAGDAPLLFLCDADIVHDPGHLRVLVAQSERFDLDLVSEMVELACDSWAERALVPAFVFFFQLLYPFDRVNDPLHATAAAAGGTMLLRASALRRIGGIQAIRGALIDDVTLAARIKQGGRIWLGHATMARSVRPYPSVADIWQMITRTAYVQLRYSPLLLLLTTLAMAVTWVVPPVTALAAHGWVRWVGVATWVALATSYLPTLRRFRRSWLWAPFLPLVACFYMAATIGSAVNHVRGRGAAWKGRAYQGMTG